MSGQVSSRKPFGLPTNARPGKSGDIILRWQKGEGPYKRNEIQVGTEMIDKWKVITAYVGYDHAGNPGKDGKRRVFSKIEVLPPKTICTETYLVIGAYGSKTEAKNLMQYMKTKFFRFLVSQYMYSHHITKESYAFVPTLDMKTEWTDEMLFKRYKLTSEEIKFLNSKIRSMDNKDA
jgi:site-specific DNA-methyltransferase (adenine-specific)